MVENVGRNKFLTIFIHVIGVADLNVYQNRKFRCTHYAAGRHCGERASITMAAWYTDVCSCYLLSQLLTLASVLVETTEHMEKTEQILF